MATLDELKVELSKATKSGSSKPQPLSAAQYAAGFEILAQDSDIEEDKRFLFDRFFLNFSLFSSTLSGKMSFLAAYTTRSAATFLEEDILTKYTEMRLVGG